MERGCDVEQVKDDVQKELGLTMADFQLFGFDSPQYAVFIRLWNRVVYDRVKMLDASTAEAALTPENAEFVWAMVHAKRLSFNESLNDILFNFRRHLASPVSETRSITLRALARSELMKERKAK